MIVMMIAITPSLNAFNLSLFIFPPLDGIKPPSAF
jgi:hypothetical protein